MTSTGPYGRQVGRRLRRGRESQRLTIAAVEVLSRGRFKPVTVAAYERRDPWALSVEKAAQVAALYGGRAAGGAAGTLTAETTYRFPAWE